MRSVIDRVTTERSAARSAHQSGGLGVVGSNPAAPTISREAMVIILFQRFHLFFRENSHEVYS